MNACIGWHADPECPVYGDMHGCALEDGHNGYRHRCACGETDRKESCWCGLPLTYSHAHRRHWCSVWGTHARHHALVEDAA